LTVAEGGSGGVGDGDGAFADAVHETGHAEAAVLAEGEGIDVILVEAAVDHVDGFEAADGFEEDLGIEDDEVAAGDEGDAHLPGEVAVLVIGLIVEAGGEQDDAGFAGGATGVVAKMFEQGGGVA
jgi:hypothetical protein